MNSIEAREKKRLSRNQKDWFLFKHYFERKSNLCVKNLKEVDFFIKYGSFKAVLLF